MLARRDHVRGATTVRQLLADVKETLAGAYAHQKLPFARVCELIGVTPSEEREPLFDVVILLENINDPSHAAHLKNDLTLTFDAGEGRLAAAFEYRPELFVQPAAGDAGGAAGAAAIAHVRLTGEAPPRKQQDHVYLGPALSSAEIFQILKSTSAKFQDFRGREEELIGFTVDQLVEGTIIGWAQGRMEFGPRALGSRSILADPRRYDMRDRINALVKMREAFRPFAPAVLESEAAEHFALDHPSPFMLETCQVTSPVDLPAITHVDGSARVQTVSAETNPRFAALLEEFKRRTGCPILLNTSFNMRGEPIVCTAVDALICFVRSNIDFLVIEDFIIGRSGIPILWEIMATQGSEKHMLGEGEEVGHLVYTLL